MLRGPWPIWKILAAFLLGVLAMGVAADTGVSLIERWDLARQRLPFHAAAWRARSFDDEPRRRPTRQRMVADLMTRLDGLPRKEVEEMLGRGDVTARWPEWHLKYALGPAPGLGHWLDAQWLVIRFGSTERVESYRLVVD